MHMEFAKSGGWYILYDHKLHVYQLCYVNGERREHFICISYFSVALYKPVPRVAVYTVTVTCKLFISLFIAAIVKSPCIVRLIIS